jgi:hypothetical protein
MLLIHTLLISFVNPFCNTALFYRPTVHRRTSLFLETDLLKSLEPPSGGELKLLTHLNAGSWTYNWLMYISSQYTEDFDEHYYMDFFNMRTLSSAYTSPTYFYLGFYPDGVNCKNGPKYLGLFELQTTKRIFNTKYIVENPYYVDGDSKLLEFKKSLIHLTDTAFVFLNYKELNRPEQLRYYMSWNYD